VKIADYVGIRCSDAGVHAGVVAEIVGRTCALDESRRLWYWKPTDGQFLSAVAVNGVHSDSKLGLPVSVILTEDCEIIHTSAMSEKSIRCHINEQ